MGDTAEVAAAKAHFQAAYDAAAAAADHDVNFVSNFHDVIVPHDGKYVTYAGKYSPGVYPYGLHAYGAYPYGAFPYGAYPYGALPYAFGYHPLLVAKPEEAAAEEGERKKRSLRYYPHHRYYGPRYHRYGHYRYGR